jgi:hypothetical protein
MNLYLLEQEENSGYDTYDSMVVAAETEDKARLIHPNTWLDNPWDRTKFNRDWATSPDQVSVKLIGTAVEGTKSGVILSSFNAG